MTQNNPQTEQTNLDLLNLKVTDYQNKLNDMKKSDTEPLILFLQYFDTILACQDRNFWENSFLITNNTTKLVDSEKNQQEIIKNQQEIRDLVNILGEKIDKLAEKKTFWEKIKSIFKK
jgi:hypothetical protein